MNTYQDNRRLESMIFVMESLAKELSISTRRFTETNDRLAEGLKRKLP